MGEEQMGLHLLEVVKVEIDFDIQDLRVEGLLIQVSVVVEPLYFVPVELVFFVSVAKTK